MQIVQILSDARAREQKSRNCISKSGKLVKPDHDVWQKLWAATRFSLFVLLKI
jgi:hypothetical protein